MNNTELYHAIQTGELDQNFEGLYHDSSKVRERYCEIVQAHQREYGEKEEVFLFSTPGRTEICGNHTDHQQGRVLAGAISLDIIAAVSRNDDGVIRILSKGYKKDEIKLTELSRVEAEVNKAASLIRGVAFRMKELGCPLCGFDAYTTSNVLSGSGLSSSAAFEVLVATILNSLFNENKLSMVELAKISQFAECAYFGKPSGLMDQTACAVGGCVEIDFQDPVNPELDRIQFDLAKHGYKLVIVNTGASHANLTDDYASIPKDMRAVAAYFGATVLRDVNEQDFYSNLKQMRDIISDKALLRAAHFFGENERVVKAASALKQNDAEVFFRTVRESGKSSYELLQNVYSDSNPNEQSVALALCLTSKILGDTGAYRVHGGGFAGTIQAFVKAEKLTEYVQFMEEMLFPGCCYVLDIRPRGSVRVY